MAHHRAIGESSAGLVERGRSSSIQDLPHRSNRATRRHETHAHGFTIVELIIVIAVIAILAAIIVAGYIGVTTRANDAVTLSDLKSNLERIDLFYAKHGRTPSSEDAATGDAADDFKIKISKQSIYKFYGYCTGSLSGEREVIMTAGTVNGHQFYISSTNRVIKDVSADFDLESALWGEYKCLDYLRPGSSAGEFRNMIHRDGGVEGAYITTASP